MLETLARFRSLLSQSKKSVTVPAQTKETPETAILIGQKEESILHKKLYNLALCDGITFESYEKGRAIFIGYGMMEHTEHSLPLSDLPVFYAGIKEDQEYFLQLSQDGITKIQIDGDLPFKLFSPYGDFRLDQPSDRPALPIGIGGQAGFYAIKEQVEISLILESYKNILRECEKAARASMSLENRIGAAPLPKPATC